MGVISGDIGHFNLLILMDYPIHMDTITKGQISKIFVRKVVIIFYSISLKMCFGCSKEPYRDGSFEYPQHIFWLQIRKINFQLRTLICGPE